MDDLSSAAADRRRPPGARNRGVLGRPADRRWPRADLALWLLAACAASPGPRPAAAAAPGPELWCDASALPGGDGTRARPLKALPAEVAPGLAVHALSGVYAGPVRLGPGASLTGHGVVVVTGGPAAVAVSLDGAALRGVSVQGGEVGVEARGEVSLEAVRWSAQRSAALRAGPGSRVRAARLEVVGTLPGVDGLVGEGAELEVRGARFTGGLRRAVAVRGGALTLEGAQAEGPATLLHAVEARATVRDATATGGGGPALFAAGGQLRAERLTVVGHEYAVQAARGEVVLEEVTARGPRQAGLALRRTTARVRGLTVERAGEEGGVMLDEAVTSLEAVTVRGAGAWGVLVRLGSARLDRVTVESIRAEAGDGPGVLGDGLVVRDAQVDGRVVQVQDVEGSGLVVSAQAVVRLEALTVRRSGGPGVLVDRGARLELGRLEVHGAWGPALVASEGGQAGVGVLSAAGAEGPVWADCDTGAQVTVRELDGAAPPPPSRCVRVGPAPP